MMLPPYADLRSSGARLLGEVPSHWRIEKLRALVKPRNERNRPELPLLSVARERGVFVRAGSGEENHNVIPDDLSNYKVARQGDLVINKMKAWQGSMGVAPCDGIVSPAYFVFRLAVEHVRFGQALLRSRPYVGMFAAASDGVRVGQWDLSIDGMKEIPVLLPPDDEQATIVRFLDHVSGRIERAIRAKRKAIALLQEQKQVIIRGAVTRGIDSTVPLKHSGLSWLGSIPQHWNVTRNMALFAHRVEAGVAGLPVLQVSLRSGITPEELDQFGRRKRLIADPTKYKRIQRGDIAYNTMRMWQGAVGVSPSDGLVSPAYVVLAPREASCPAFYDLVFHTDVYMQQVNRQSTGIVSDRNRLYWDSFKQMPNLVLPRTEQEAIVAFICAETRGLDNARAQLDREVELLREYRIRLTADVVTGKLDVREAASKLPDETFDDIADSILDPIDDPIDEEAVVE